MKRKKDPMESLGTEDKEAKGKVAMVLSVLAGEKSISEACREAGLKPVVYYKLEERMLGAMVATAKIPAKRGKRRDPLAEMNQLTADTQELRQEHRRLQSLVRVTRKLTATGPRRRGPGRPPKAQIPSPSETGPRRTPQAQAAQA